MMAPCDTRRKAAPKPRIAPEATTKAPLDVPTSRVSLCARYMSIPWMYKSTTRHVPLKRSKLPDYSGYVNPPSSRQALGPILLKMGPTTKSAVAAVAESRATLALAATVGST